MINSGLEIKSYEPYQNGILKNIKVNLNYPMILPNGIRQNINDNKLENGDIIVDADGNIWNVDAVVYNSADNTFDCNLTIHDNETAIINEITNINKCIAITPNNKGLLSPYYHDSYVSTKSFRAAMSYNMKKYMEKLKYKLEYFFDFNNTLQSSTREYTLERYGTSPLEYELLEDLNCCRSGDKSELLITEDTGFVFSNFNAISNNSEA